MSFFFLFLFLIRYNKKICTLFFSCASCFDNQYCFKWCLLDIFYSFTQRNQRGKMWNSKFTQHLENKFTYKFSQNSRHKVWPWLVWSIIYVLIGVSCGIYELCLGGTVLEVTLVPVAYLAIFSLWSYAIWSVFDYFKSMKVSATADTVSPDGEFYSKALFLIGITRVPRVFVLSIGSAKD